MTAPTGHRSQAVNLAFFADLASVAVFIALGRRTHEGTGLAGYLQTLRPFLIALLAVWLVSLLVRALITPTRADGSEMGDWRAGAGRWLTGVWPAGVLVWVVTAGGGLALRAAGGGGLAGGFPYVTFGVLGAFMLGWRLAVAGARRRR